MDGSPSGDGRPDVADGASLPSEGEVQFRPAPGDRGTEVTLRIRFDPPGGALGLGLLVPYLFYRSRKPSWKQPDEPQPTEEVSQA